ncbi:MAG: radical SAM protein [Desulfuromonadales bacterium]
MIEHALNKGSVVVPYPPFRLRIEPTNICNLRCVSCPNAVEKPQHQGFMDMTLYKGIVDQAKNFPSPTLIILYLGGEPLLHKELIEMINYASKSKILVQFNTNSTLLTTAMINELLDTELDRITFSFDDMLPDEYEAFRKNSSYNNTLDNILSFLRIKKERKKLYPHVSIASLKVFRPGDEISRPVISDNFISQFIEYKVEISSAYVHSWAGDFEIYDGTLAKPIAGISADYDAVRIKKTPKCKLPWYDIVINYRGEVVNCCFDLQYKHVMGDTKKDKIIDIWNNKKHQELRRTILRKKYDNPLCLTCSTIKGDPFSAAVANIQHK